jgi:WXXGXW repeat (2 copies)
MRFNCKAGVLATMLLVTVVVTNGQVSLGIRIGPPPRERVVRVMPQQPGAEFVWVGGYWYPEGRHYKWHEGYWSRPPYEGARWVAPHHDGQQYYAGYWDGNRGHVEHDHQSDHQRDRDFRDQGQ